MDGRSLERCPHYQLYLDRLGSGEPAAYLPFRRCMLTERMICLLEPHADNTSFASRVAVRHANGAWFAFVGPDFEAVTQTSCTRARCEQQCTVSYTSCLANFDIEDPRIEEVVCTDATAELNAAR